MKSLWVKFCCFLGWFGFRWRVSHIECDMCGEPMPVYSDLTIAAHVNPDQSIICQECLDFPPEI